MKTINIFDFKVHIYVLKNNVFLLIYIYIHIIAGGKDASTKGSCLDDTFSISVPGGKSTGVICGKNSGEHCTYSTTKYLTSARKLTALQLLGRFPPKFYETYGWGNTAAK